MINQINCDNDLPTFSVLSKSSSMLSLHFSLLLSGFIHHEEVQPTRHRFLSAQNGTRHGHLKLCRMHSSGDVSQSAKRRA